MANKLDVKGLMNVQFAIKDKKIYVIEVNPRASRTIPFVSKSIGISVAKIAAKCMLGVSIKKQKLPIVLYGGSVDGKNIGQFKKLNEIDGFLIGGASKSDKKFIDIIKNYYR